MHVNLDNICFYHHPPPPKPPLPSLPTSCWMSYQDPSAPLSFSHPLPTKPPLPAAATVPTLATRPDPLQTRQTSVRDDHDSHVTIVRNEFDVELERISDAEITKKVQEADLERPHNHDVHDRATSDAFQNQSTPSIVKATPARPQASASDSNETASQYTVDQDPLQDQSERWVCRSVEAVSYSDPGFNPAGADLDCSGPYVVTELHRDCIPPLEACSKTNAQIPLSVVSEHSGYICRPPSADSSDSLDTTPGPRGGSCAETMQCDETAVEEARNGVLGLGDQAKYPSTEVAITPSVCNDKFSVEESSPASHVEHKAPKEVRPAALSCPDRHHLHLNDPLEARSKRIRSLRPRPNANTRRPERSPSVSVVIPVRKSDRLMASAAKNHPIQLRRRDKQDGSENNDGTNCTATQDSNDDRYRSEEERPQKRRKHTAGPRNAAESDSTSANLAIGGVTNSIQNPPGSDIGSLDEAQEVFGRGVLRIQPLGNRRSYFITFLPDLVQPLPISSTPGVSRKKSSFSDGHRPQNQSSRQTIRRRRHKRSPYSPAENQLLSELRNQRGLPWREVSKHFKHRTQASLQVQYSKIRGEAKYKA